VSVAPDTLVREDVAVTSVVAQLPRVNLLPPEIAANKAFRVLQLRLAAVVVVALAVVGLVYFQVAGGESSARNRLDAAQAQSTTLQHKISNLSNVTQTAKQLEAAEGALAKAMGSEVRWSRYLNDLSITLPSNVWVTNLTVTETAAPNGSTAAASSTAGSAGKDAAPSLGSLSIQGKALSFNDVAVWLETLAKEKGYTNVWLTQGATEKIGDQEVVDFTSTVGFTPQVLSQRYTKQAGN
jgi:Tfp pilus assembly protein PilN